MAEGEDHHTPHEDRRKAHDQLPVLRGRQGRVSYTLAALAERIERQLYAELAGREDILQEAVDEEKRRAIVADAGDYVLAVESVAISPRDRRALFDLVDGNVFGLGPLDGLIRDGSVTGLTIDGASNVLVQHNMGPYQPAPVLFDDEAHLREMVQRLAAAADVELLESEPFFEFGFQYRGRRGRLEAVLPPFSPVVHVDLRLHPVEPVTLASLQQHGMLDAASGAVLSALARSPFGCLIAGEPGSGKTLLLEALLGGIGGAETDVLVERAAEIRAPEPMRAVAAVPPRQSDPGVSFASQLATALAEAPSVLAVDELRGDDSGAVWDRAHSEIDSRLLLVFRSSPDPERLYRALSLLVLKGQPGLTQPEVDAALVQRLPFVLTMVASEEGPRLARISEWQPAEGAFTLVTLLAHGKFTGSRPVHRLSVPESIWNA